MKKLFLILVALGPASAGLFDILGGQKVGTTSLVFLKIGVGAKAAGMGECFVAVADDASCLYWNPAGAAFFQGPEAGFSHVDWLQDITYEYAAVTRPLGSYASLGFQVGCLHAGYIEETDEYHPEGTGEFFSFSDFLAGITYSRKLTDRFAFGVGVKFLSEKLADLHTRGVALDLGTLYQVGYRDIRVGVSLSNLGPDLRPGGGEVGLEPFPLPIVYRMGVSGLVLPFLRLSLQLDKPSDNVETFRAGAELTVATLNFRIGQQLNSRSPGEGLENLSFGVGATCPSPFGRAKVDYAFVSRGYAGDVHRLSVGLALK